MSTHISYEARTARGALIERHELQHRAEAAALHAATRNQMTGAHVVMVTTTVRERTVYTVPEPSSRPAPCGAESPRP